MNASVKKYGPALCAGLLFLIFFFTRFYRLSTLPYGLHIDEAGAAYDALCLARFGVDRYLSSWPVYLTNFGSGQSALYAWLCALLFRIYGGYHVLLLRSVSVGFNLLTLIFCMKLARRLCPESPLASLSAGILVVISPCFLLMSRFGLDCNLMVGMSTVFLFLLSCALKSGRIRYYIGAGICGGLVLYTYALSYFVMPVFLLLLFFWVLYVKKFSFKGWIAMAIPMGILAFPLILVQIVNIFDLPQMQLGIFTVTKLASYRSYDLHSLSLSRLILAWKSILLGDDLEYNSVPGFLNFYALTVPLFLIGLLQVFRQVVRAARKRELCESAPLLFWLFSCLLTFSVMNAGAVNNVNGVLSAVLLIAVIGLWSVVGLFRGAWKTWAILCIGAVYAFGFCSFGRYYFGGRYAADYPQLSYFDITVEEAVDFLESHPEAQGLGTWMAQAKIYYAISASASPFDMDFDTEDVNAASNGSYHFGGLGLIEEGYNYIVPDIYPDYANQLRELGYLELDCGGYSLFYQLWNEP